MTLDIVPKKFLSFPSLSLANFWDDGEEWFTSHSAQDGLSIYEDKNKVYVETAVPGIDPKDVEITFQDGYLWVRGETKEEGKDKGKRYYRKASRSFSYRIAVPGEIDINKEPEATYNNGIMTVAFAKSPKAKPKKIKIKMIGK